MQLNFDPTKHEPNQGTPKHPTGKFPAVISEVGTDGNDNVGWFWVNFTTPSGQIQKRYNLWAKTNEPNMETMKNIAHQNLAALCHAVGWFKMVNDGRELLNSRCMIEVTPQAKNPQYNEVSKVYDPNGNEPGKVPSQPQMQPSGGQQNGQAAGWATQANAQNNASTLTPASQQGNPAWSQQQQPQAGGAPDWSRGPSGGNVPSGAPTWAQNK